MNDEPRTSGSPRAASATSAPLSAQLRIGVASADITPPVGVALAGYGPRSGKVADSVGHPLRAECLTCEGETGAWALLTSDVCGYPGWVVRRVRERICRSTGLPATGVLIAATHTHSGPASMEAYAAELGRIDRDYEVELEDTLVRLMQEAWRQRQPGAFEIAEGAAPELASNRRVRSDGAWTNEWRDPQGRHDGYFDPALMLTGVRRTDGSLDALMVNYGCHPVVLGPSSLAISADYPGYLKHALESSGLARTALFVLAGAANINPRVCIEVGAEHPRRMGEALAARARQASSGLRPARGGEVRSASIPWTLVSARSWAAGSERRRGDRIETEVMALRAGGLVILGIPGELFSEYNERFRTMASETEGGADQTVIVSMANDAVGYLPVDEAFDQGGHEIRMAATSKPLGEELTDRVGRALRQIATPGSV